MKPVFPAFVLCALLSASAAAQISHRQDLITVCLAGSDRAAADSYCSCIADQMLISLSEADQAFYADMMMSFQSAPGASPEEKRMIASDLRARHPFSGPEDYKAHLKAVGLAATQAAGKCKDQP